MFHAPTLPLDPNAPYMPAQCAEKVTKIASPFPNADAYSVDPPFFSEPGEPTADTFSIAKGTALDDVTKQAAILASSKKFIRLTTDPGDLAKGEIVNQATVWWAQHVLPAFPLPKTH